MTKTLFVVFLLLQVVSLSQAQSAQTKAAAIRTIYAAINTDKTLHKKVLENEDFLENMTDGGGELTGFYQGTELKKISSWIGISRGNETDEFYFNTNHLVFVYKRFNSFFYDTIKQVLQLDSTVVTFEGRYYFSGNKIFRQIEAGDNNDGDQGDISTYWLKQAADYRKLLSRPPKEKK